MEVRSSRRLRILVTQMANSGLSANEIADALISMMARSKRSKAKAGYIDARPLSPSRGKSLATHGRTIHRVKSRPNPPWQLKSSLATTNAIIGEKLLRAALGRARPWLPPNFFSALRNLAAT